MRDLDRVLEGKAERAAQADERAAWMVMHLVNKVARKLKQAETMTSLLGAWWLKRQEAREARKKKGGAGR